MPGRLQRGITPASKAALLAAVKRRDVAADAALTRALAIRRRNVGGALAPFDSKLAAAAAKSTRAKAAARKLLALHAEFRRELDSAPGAGARRAAFDAHRARVHAATAIHEAALARLVDATIDPDSMLLAQARALTKGKPRYRLLRGRLGLEGLQLVPLRPFLGTPTSAGFELSPPFDEDVSATRSSTGGVAATTRDADADGHAATSAVCYVAGGGSSTAVVGEFITIPPGFTHLDVAMEVDYNFFCAAGAVPGGAGADAYIVLELVARNGSIQSSDHHLASVLAPVLWVTSESGDDRVTVSARFGVSEAGAEMMLRGGVRSEVWAGGVTVVTSAVNISIQTITATAS